MCKGLDCKMDRTLRWRRNGHGGVSNHQPHHCLLNRLFGCSSKKTSKLRVTGLCVGNSPWTGEFPAQMANNAENVSIWWRHHDHEAVFINKYVHVGGETIFYWESANQNKTIPVIWLDLWKMLCFQSNSLFRRKILITTDQHRFYSNRFHNAKHY